MTMGVHAFEVLATDEWSVNLLKVIDQAGFNQLIFHRLEASRLLGMMGAHLVQQAVFMGDERGCQTV